jgi:hypothetical protein
MRRFRRISDDHVQLRLPHAEKALLASVLPQLRAVVDGDTGAEHLRTRLFPPAYEDPEHEREFRELVRDDLVEQRRAAVDTALATLEGGRTRARQWSVDLDPEQVQSWLSVLHDLRLVLAQVVGITTEADWERSIEGADPADLLLWHVGALQEELLGVLMTGLGDDG